MYMLLVNKHFYHLQLSRTLKAKPCPIKALLESDPALTSYAIEVHTGNVRGGGTCANVFVTLMGSKSTSSKTLVKSDNGLSHFDRGSVVTTQLECTDIGRIKSLTIEHDNSGFGPDWFLDRIMVYRSEKPEKKAYFQCQQWLSRTEGDGVIQRVLQPSSSPPEPSVGKTYLVSTQTGYQRGAGTDANVYVTLYGSLGSSGERWLDNHPANFERGRYEVCVHVCVCVCVRRCIFMTERFTYYYNVTYNFQNVNLNISLNLNITPLIHSYVQPMYKYYVIQQ